MASPGQIIQWIQFALLILKYGKELVELAVSIYEKVEEKLKGRRPIEKKMEFDKTLIGRAPAVVGTAPTVKTINALREGVWKTRPENAGKTPKPLYPLPEGYTIVGRR